MQIYGFLAQVEYQSVKHKYQNTGLKQRIINKINIEWKEWTSEKQAWQHPGEQSITKSSKSIG